MTKKLYQDDPIDFISFEDLKRYRQNQKVRFVCSRCGETDIKYAVYLSNPVLCKKCKRKDFIDNFDFDARNKKSEKTKLERYGDPHYTNRQKSIESWNNKSKEEKEEIYRRVSATNNERYGCHPASRQEQKERTKQTCIERYGAISPSLSQEVKDKIEQTNLERYGVKNVFSNEDIKKKIAKTNLERYGVDNPRKSKVVDETYSKDYLKLFKTDISFPYPNADFKDKSLDGIIRHFHKSIYHANRKGFKSPYDAFNDPILIEKSAMNRLKYTGSCKPSDIVYGFNVAKIVPKVSVFSPTVAKNLI